MKTIKYGWGLYRRYLKQAFFAFFLSVGAVVVSLFLPKILGYIIDYVFSPIATPSGATSAFLKYLEGGSMGAIGTMPLLVSLGLLFSALALLKASLNYGKNLYMQSYGNVFNKDVRTEGVKKLFQLNDYENAGDLYLVLTNDAWALKELFLFQFPQFVEYLVIIVLSLVLLFFTNWILGLVMLVCLPITILIEKSYVKKSYKYCLLSRNCAGKISNAISESISAIRDIKKFGFEGSELATLAKTDEEYLQAKKDTVDICQKHQTGIQAVRALFYALAIVVSGVLAIKGIISIGVFSVAVLYAIMFLDAINNAVARFFICEEMFSDGSIFRTFIQKRNKITNNKTKQLITQKPKIECIKLSFEKDGVKVLNRVNIVIPYGKKLGVFANQGEGKTALANIIMRKIMPTSGGIFMNDADYLETDIEEIRKQFSFVPQTPYIFGESLLKNIVMFDENVDYVKLQKILDSLKLMPYISKLPRELNTTLKENGAEVPNQEKQLISIARALYRDANVLLMDSPVERFSNSEKRALLKKIFNFYKGKTIIMFSSDATLLKQCDEIIVVEGGKIAQSGTYQTLEQTCETFAHNIAIIKDSK